MGCFLACFGVSSNKKKRRKPPKRILLGDKSHGSYQPLDSVSHSVISNKSSAKIKKKVRFDLNVRAYEPIQTADESEPDLREISREENEGKICSEASGQDPVIPGGAAQSVNYRYQNCRDSYEDEDELLFEDSDFEYDSDDEIDSYDVSDDDVGSGDLRRSNEDSSSKLSHLSPNSEEEREEAPLMALHVDTVQEQKTQNSNEMARLRSKYSNSVLNPVENLTQWKAIKAKEAPQKQRSKENVASEQLVSSKKIPGSSPLNGEPNSQCSKPVKREVMVNTSLSNWLPVSKPDLSETAHNIKSNPILIKNASTRQGMSY